MGTVPGNRKKRLILCYTRPIVLYKLADNMDEDEFVQWRRSTQKQSVESMPGVLRTDFSRIGRSWPEDMAPKFRFQTIVDWPDRESFENAFF